MELPLLIRAREDNEQFLLSPGDGVAAEAVQLMPGRLPAAENNIVFTST